MGQVSTSSGFSHWGIIEGSAQSLASETPDKLRLHDFTQTGSTTPSLSLQSSVCFCWPPNLSNCNSGSRHLAPSSGLHGHYTHMLHRRTSKQTCPKCSDSVFPGLSHSPPTALAIGLCPEAPWVPSAPVRGAKGRLQCAQVQILIGQHLTTSQGPSSSR